MRKLLYCVSGGQDVRMYVEQGCVYVCVVKATTGANQPNCPLCEGNQHVNVHFVEARKLLVCCALLPFVNIHVMKCKLLVNE